MTTCNFQGTSLLFSKVVRVQSKQDNQGCRKMIGPMLWLQPTSDWKNIGLEKQQKTLLTLYNALYASKLQDYVIALSECAKT